MNRIQVIDRCFIPSLLEIEMSLFSRKMMKLQVLDEREQTQLTSPQSAPSQPQPQLVWSWDPEKWQQSDAISIWKCPDISEELLVGPLLGVTLGTAHVALDSSPPFLPHLDFTSISDHNSQLLSQVLWRFFVTSFCSGLKQPFSCQQ